MLVSHLLESDFDDDLPLLARIILRRMKTDEVKIWAKLSNGSNRVFGDIVGIRMGAPLKVGGIGKGGALAAPEKAFDIPRLFIKWKHMTRPGGKEEWVRADSFDDRYDFKKDEDGHWILTNRVKQVDEEVDVSLLEKVLQKLLDKGEEVNLFWRIDDQDKLEWQGRITSFQRKTEGKASGKEIEFMVIAPGGRIPQAFGYVDDDLERCGEFTRIDGKPALAVTGNMSAGA
jgi:hypothetical protein